MNVHIGNTTKVDADPVDVYVGLRVRTLRKSQHISQTGLAEALGLTFQQIQKYERGFNRISASRLYYIARHLGQPVAWFFEGLDETQPNSTAGNKLITQLSDDDVQAIAHSLAKLPAGLRRSVRIGAVALATDLAKTAAAN